MTKPTTNLSVANGTITYTPQRLYSLDALRGFDMFWIMGAEEIVHAMAKATGNSFWAGVFNPANTSRLERLSFL